MNKTRGTIAIFAVLAVAIICLFFIFKQERQHYIFLIPQNYTGEVKIIFDQSGAPPLLQENNATLVEIPESGTTSTSDSNKTGIIDYYFVDKSGQRTKIENIQDTIHNLHTQSGNNNGQQLPETIEFVVGSKK